MSKTIQIEESGGGIYALQDDGQIFYGFFVQTRADNLTPPEFMWRKIPNGPKENFTFKIRPEPKSEDVAEAIKAADANSKQLFKGLPL